MFVTFITIIIYIARGFGNLLRYLCLHLGSCIQEFVELTFDDFQSSIKRGSLVYLIRTKLNAPRFTVCFKSSNVYRSAHVGFFLFYSNLFTPWGFRSRRTIYLTQRSRPCVLLASLKWKNAKYQYYTLRLFSVIISPHNYKHRKLPIFMQFFHFIWCNAKMCFKIKKYLQLSNSFNKWE